jgi:RNA polymerase sigma factor (sigma-70 family)
MPNQNDDDLVRAILEGDMDAAEILFERYRPYIFRIMSNKTRGNPMKADDLTHDVLLKILDNLKTYTPQGKFQQWVNRIINNVYIDDFRCRGRFESTDALEPEVTPRQIHGMPPPPALDMLMQDELRGFIDQAVNAIFPEDYKIAFTMRDFEKHSLAEIAEVFGITEKAAKMKAFRGRQQFREIIQRIAPDYF